MATNVQTIQGEWTYLCGLAKQRWSQLTEDDLGALEGNIEKLIGRIQQKTGEGREAIEKFFSDATLAQAHRRSRMRPGRPASTPTR